jgi:hypothetical protein
LFNNTYEISSFTAKKSRRTAPYAGRKRKSKARMKIFKSKIRNSFLYLILKLVFICVLVFPFIAFTKLKSLFFELSSFNWILIGIFTIVFIITYLSLTNTDIKILKNEIKFSGKLLLSKKNTKFSLDEIIEITMKHDWAETVLADFKPKFLKFIIVEWILKTARNEEAKWIKVKTKSGDYKFYCYGIEYDCYDNPKPHFEDLYFEFAKLNLEVNWTENNDVYYKNLKQRKEFNK